MLEYVLTKERIRKTIEADTSVDINTFIENPYRYKELIKTPEIVWIKDLINEDSRVNNIELLNLSCNNMEQTNNLK